MMLLFTTLDIHPAPQNGNFMVMFRGDDNFNSTPTSRPVYKPAKNDL